MRKKIFAFDMGKASIGYCVREGHDIKTANSVIIDIEHSDVSLIRDRRRVHKTILAHNARMEYFNKIWKECGLETLSKEDSRFKKEFPANDEDVIYTSCLLRIALLQNKQLEHWQIYKALHNAIQRRGYDNNLAWKTGLSDDDKENEELIKKYTQENGIELINSDEYKYPCYYDAIRLGLWSEDEPDKFNKTVNQQNCIKVRSTNYVAPRGLVVRELTLLWKNAQLQLPALKKYSVEKFLYGEYEAAYGSYVNPVYRRYMGTERDWQGVLGQKIPRFDNRIISKCKLMPKRNVCKADTLENVTVVLLFKLKNLRFTVASGEKIRLNPVEIKTIYENWLDKLHEKNDKLDTTITKKEIETVINKKILDKIEPLKANIIGRSAFCRPACKIMTEVILSGELNPQDIDITPFADPAGTKNGITEEEIRTMLSKIGDWNNLYIPDNRDELAAMGNNSRIKTDLMIGNITNPIVRNRLQIFRDLLLALQAQYGTPDEVIFEFVREGADNSLFGQKKANDALKHQKDMEKENEQIKKELSDALIYSPANFDKLKLLKMQGGKSIYPSKTGAEEPLGYSIYSWKPIGIGDLDKCEIDHIYPRTAGGNDALYNRVLCYREENQAKAGRTPYEWLSKDETVWANYVGRLSEIKLSLGKKKYELLTSKPEDCAALIDSYNGLAETSHIARVAQQITAFVFNWGLQVEGEHRHIFVNNGSSTHAIRKRYGLNYILGDKDKKNRDNDKHHALDAICISYSREFKYDKESQKDTIPGFDVTKVKEVIDEIMPYPYTNKKPLKSNVRPLETIYGFREYGSKQYITSRVSIEAIEQKEKKIKTIIDKVIKQDLLEKLTLNMTAGEWAGMLKNYIHPKKKTHVKKVMLIVSEGLLEKDKNGRMRIGEYCDFGTKGTAKQFKHSKGHKGQILYYNEKGIVKVMPIYSNVKTEEVKEKLLSSGCKPYNKGEVFYAGCLVNIPEEFQAGTMTYSSGVYKIRTITSAGQIKLENNNGIEILSSAANLVRAKFFKVKS